MEDPRIKILQKYAAILWPEEKNIEVLEDWMGLRIAHGIDQAPVLAITHPRPCEALSMLAMGLMEKQINELKQRAAYAEEQARLLSKKLGQAHDWLKHGGAMSDLVEMLKT
jgi:hypothetical protein